MNEINSNINNLLARADKDHYNPTWEMEAVETLNDYFEEKGYYDDHIYETDSDEWEQIVESNLKSRGWIGVKCLLEDVDNTAEYVQLDGYGNGRSVDYRLVDMLENAKEGY